MKVYTVKNYFIEGKWSYYPGDVLTPALCEARGLGADAIANHARRGNLAEAETADPPPTPDPIDFSLLAPVPAPAPEATPEPAPEVTQEPAAEPAPEPKASSRKG